MQKIKIITEMFDELRTGTEERSFETNMYRGTGKILLVDEEPDPLRLLAH
jgi:hypothetical protein